MRVLVSSEHRFRRTSDGAVWTQTAYRYEFWRRYLEVFDDVLVLTRALNVAGLPSGWHRADGPAVSFAVVPHYLGPFQYLLRYRAIDAAARRALSPDAAVIMRVPSILAAHWTRRLYATGQPYGVEVVGDPWDAFGPGSVEHPLRPFLRRWLPWQLRRQCARASAVAYVTRFALQARYPCRAFGVGVSDIQLPLEAIRVEDNVLATHYSSIELGIGDCVSHPQPDLEKNGLRIVTVASLEQRYKGVDRLIAAAKLCRQAGMDVRLTVIGDGRYKGDLEGLAAREGLAPYVNFLGQIPSGDAVRRELDRSDLFVLASLTEGLPRAMIEAMARALSCIGTAVGGIPELLDPADLVPPGDERALAGKIMEVARDRGRMARMSARNRATAREYSDPVLRERRLAFYSHLRQVTAKWLSDRQVPCELCT